MYKNYSTAIFAFLSLTIFCQLTLASPSTSMARVPHIFTGNSPAPEYQSYPKYQNKVDQRDSTDFNSYYLNLEKVNALSKAGQVRSVHAHVRNIAKDGICAGTCFRVFIYVNGDVKSGEHVATFAVSPGTGRRTPLANNAPLRRFTRSLTSFERPTQYYNYDMYRIYGSKSYPGKIPNMPNAMFFMDAIALHGSFDTVDGEKRSHGCIRMFPDESYFVHSLAILAEGNMTFDVLHTR